MYQAKKQIQVPSHVNLEKWKKCTLNDKFDLVFGFGDPSRKMFKDLPYQIQIVSRKYDDFNGRSKCAFCQREECKSCPLPFDDKISLQEYLDRARIST